jgi:transketolase
VCYHNANVKIVIIGGGMAYGPLGISHHSTEDLAILRALPNLVVVAPSDLIEAEAAVRAMIEHEGPVYYRCGYKGEPDIHDGPVDFAFGKALTVREGTDAAILFTGTVGYNARLAVETLAKEGVNCRLVSMHTVKPIDEDAILEAAKTGAIVTLEEHNLCGGLGGAVAEVLMDRGAGGVKFRRIAIPDENVCAVGSQQWLREKYGMDPASIARAVRDLL